MEFMTPRDWVGAVALVAALIYGGWHFLRWVGVLTRCERRERWDNQTPGQRFRDGLRNPANNPPGRGFNTDE